MKHKIALLTDSGSDVPYYLVKELGIFVAPLQVNYKDHSYRDGIDIDAKTMYEQLPIEVPSTSLPLGDDITKIFEQIKANGYTHILAILLSSGLSGTFNLINLMESEAPVPMKVLDTKNIGIGSGLTVIKAAEFISSGLSFEEVIERVEETIEKTKVYFVLDTLEYLKKGGRIGKVSALIGYALDLRPIITCNDEGIYTTIAKARGRNVSINRCLQMALDFVKDAETFTVGLAHGQALEEVLILKKRLEADFGDKVKIYVGQVSPALGVHTGPGLIGMGIQID